MILLLPITALGIWAWFDWKNGKVLNLLLLLPLIALPFYNLMSVFMIFLPIFFVLLLIKLSLKSLGFADVVAIPFTMFFLVLLRPLSLIVFPIPIFLIALNCLWKPVKREKHGNEIRLIPYLFVAFLACCLIHSSLPLLFPAFFL